MRGNGEKKDPPNRKKARRNAGSTKRPNALTFCKRSIYGRGTQYNTTHRTGGQRNDLQQLRAPGHGSPPKRARRGGGNGAIGGGPRHSAVGVSGEPPGGSASC